MIGVPYVKLKDIATVNQGLQIPISKRFKEQGIDRYFYITVQFLKDSHNDKFYVENPPKSSICNEDDILVVRTGSTGKIVTGVNGCFHNNFFKVNYDEDKVLGRYLFYCLNSKEKQAEMKKRSGITTIPDLNHFMFLDMKIPLPSYNRQIEIVKILDAINTKIEVNNQINQQLEAMAKTLYDYWFVQFDFPISTPLDAGSNVSSSAVENDSTTSNKEPVSTALDMTSCKPYKSSGGKMVYNKELKREIPNGWEVSTIKEKLVVSLGGTPSTKVKEYWDHGDYHWLNSGEIANFPIVDSELKITEEAIKNSATDLLPKGTIAMSITRHIRPSILGIDACANQSVIGILENENIKSSFIYPMIKNEVPRYMSLRTGAQQPHINKTTVDTTFFVLPPQEILEEYYGKVDSIYNKIIVNAIENQKLTELRDWLLPMLMNGQVQVG